MNVLSELFGEREKVGVWENYLRRFHGKERGSSAN